MNDPRIRIFVDAHCFDQEYQGSRTYVKELYSVLAEKSGLLLFLAAYDVKNLARHFPLRENIVLLRYSSRSSWIRLAFDIPSMIRRHGIGLAHFQYITPLVRNCRQLITIHDVIFHEEPRAFTRRYRLMKHFLYRRSARSADLLTTVSQHARDSINKHLHPLAKKIEIIPNGVHPDWFAPYDKTQAKAAVKERYGFSRYILFVSRLEPRKNHALLLRAWMELRLYEQGFYLVLVGHRSLPTPEFDELLNSLPEKTRKFIYILNNINEPDLRKLYRGADVFVYPSGAEGFGIPPLEAAAARIPVVCSSATAMGDYSFFGDLHFSPKEPGALTEKLRQVIAYPPSEAALEAISVKIREQYCWRRSAEQLYQLIIKNHDHDPI